MILVAHLIMAWRATLSQADRLKMGPSPIVSSRLHEQQQPLMVRS